MAAVPSRVRAWRLRGVRHPVLRAVHAGVVRHLANGILARCMHEKRVHDAHRKEEQHHDDDHDEADNATAGALLGASVDRRRGRGERTNGGHACGRVGGEGVVDGDLRGACEWLGGRLTSGGHGGGSDARGGERQCRCEGQESV